MSKESQADEAKKVVQSVDLTKIRPYGDTLNDGKMQLSFTLPLACTDEAIEAAKLLMRKMGFENPQVVYYKELSEGFTHFVCYGSSTHTVDYTAISVPKVDTNVMSMDETDAYIKQHIGRKIVVIGASTGTDAHTVGIDAIMNMKGYAGHFGLERYEMFEALNMGSQVLNEDFIAKDVHIQNLTELVEMLEAEGLRHKLLLICGGPRISHELAKELGYDAGFSMNSYANHVASYIAEEMNKRVNGNK